MQDTGTVPATARLLHGLEEAAGLKGKLTVWQLGCGQYGSVWGVRGPWHSVMDAAAGRPRARPWVPPGAAAAMAALPAPAPQVAVKVRPLDPKVSGAGSVAQAQREAEVEERAQALAADALAATEAGRVPRVYGGATVSGMRMTFMEMLDLQGRTLQDLRQDGSLTVAMCRKLEAAVAVLWCTGILHGDLHARNVAFERATDLPILFDFGLAIVLGRRVREAVRRRVEEVRAAGAPLCTAWQGSPCVLRFEKVMSRRRIALGGVHPDGPCVQAFIADAARLEQQQRLQQKTQGRAHALRGGKQRPQAGDEGEREVSGQRSAASDSPPSSSSGCGCPCTR